MINQDQIKTITDDFLIHLSMSDLEIKEGEFCTPALGEALKWVDENVSADLFNLTAIGSNDQASHSLQDKERTVLFQFLEKALDFNRNPAAFLSERAATLKEQIIDASDVRLKNVRIYDSIQNLGIKEKYLRHLLNESHWLLDTDMKRALIHYGLYEKIKIVPFTELDLKTTIDFVIAIDYKDKNEPFTIPLLLNHQGSHWVAAQVTINPQRHSILYQIDDSFTLSSEQKYHYKSIIESALTKAGWTFDAASQIIGHGSQTDNYSCGYRALRQLLANPAIRGSNEHAVRYSEVPVDSKSLVRAFFADQLADVSVPSTVFDSLGRNGQKLFSASFGSQSKVKTIDPHAVTHFLGDLEQKKEVFETHQKVEAVLGSLTQESRLITFPEGAQDNSLTAAHYACFFIKLQEMNQEQNHLKRINLPYVTQEVLDGINYSCTSCLSIPFKELGLFIDDEVSAKEEFLSKLKLSLSLLSNAKLEKIEFRDEHQRLNKQVFVDLKEFVSQNGITCSILLPEQYARSMLQREFDRIIERNRRMGNNKTFSAEHSVVSPQSTTRSRIRKREELSFSHTKQVNVELQNSIEPEIDMVEIPPELPEDNTGFVLKEAVTFSSVLEAVRTNDFSAFAHLDLMMSKEDFIKACYQLFGNVVQGQLQIGVNQGLDVGNQRIDYFSQIAKISEEALQHLLKDDGHFPVGGIDHHLFLSQGLFFIQEESKEGQESHILHYDANYKNHPINTSVVKQPTFLMMDTVDEMIVWLPADHSLHVLWKNLNKSGAYDANKNQLFREVILDLLCLSDTDQEELLALCSPVDLNLERVKAFFEQCSKLARLYKEPFDATSILNVSRVDECLNLSGEDKDVRRARFIKLATQVLAPKVDQHPVLKILPLEIASQLSSALKEFELSHAQLNDLIRVYSSYGPKGMNQVVTIWKKISQSKLMPETIKHIIANSNPLQDIILSQDLLNSCTRLNDFSNNQREWFLHLYANHAPKSDRNFVELVACFSKFTQCVENKLQLSFYSLAKIQHPFTPNLDMRTAMGRMISILNACKKTDQGVQWDRIAEIDLGPSAAIYAVQKNSRNRRCFFVLPEMKISPDNEDLKRAIPYDTAVWVDAVAEAADVETAQKIFFRYLAYQKHRMPLPFYIQALAQIEKMGAKIDRQELNILYRLLAEITTGENYTNFIHDEAIAEKHWENILNTIEAAQLQAGFMYKAISTAMGGDANKQLHRDLIRSIGLLGTLPSIEGMAQLIMFMTSFIGKYNQGTIGIKGMTVAVKRLKESQTKLIALTTQYHDKIFMGMKFYTQASYTASYTAPESKQSEAEVHLFEHHLLLAEAISEKEGFGPFAIPLISTFSLDYDSIEPLYALYQQSAQSPFKIFYMNRLGAIFLDINDNRALDAQVLQELMSELLKKGGFLDQLEGFITHYLDESAEYTKKILEEIQQGGGPTDEEMEYVKSHYIPKNINTEGICKNYGELLFKLAKTQIAEFLDTNEILKAALPVAYADRLKSEKATAVVAQLINEHFKTEELKDQIGIILLKLDPSEHIKVIKGISTILNQCSTESEKQEVAKALANPKLFEEGAEDYGYLINAIKKSGSTSFVYYMQQAQSSVSSGLCSKATYFIDRALPELGSQYTHLKIAEVAPLIASVLSAAEQKEQSSAVGVGDDFSNGQDLLNSLMAAHQDPAALEIILDRLEPGQKSVFKELKALEKHLNQLKKPTITRVVVDRTEEEVATLGTSKHEGLIGTDFETRDLKPAAPANLKQKFFNFMKRVNPKTETRKLFLKITTRYQEVQTPACLDNDLLKHVILQVQEQVSAYASYGNALKKSIALIDNLIGVYPSAKSILLPLTEYYLAYQGYENELLAAEGDREAHIKKVYPHLKYLTQELIALDDQDMVISLGEHFSNKWNYKCTDLMAILSGSQLSIGEDKISFAGYTQLSAAAKKQLFKVITSLLNNKKTCTLSDISQLITHFSSDKAQVYLDAVTAIYEKAPYPELNQFYHWVQAEDPDALMQHYAQWSKNPVARENGSLPGEEPVNGFNFQDAKKQCENISGIEYSVEELRAIEAATNAVKDSTTAELLDQVNTLRANPEQANPTQLVALLAEILYRTKGLAQEGVGSQRKWGNSFEINTTQYLAVHSLLKSNRPSIAGIATGEGKSRIMMLSIAAQWVLGRTVDFVTADISLATRDYLEYQAYFKFFGAKTNLITAQTPKEHYCKGGINFSDASHLSLFRNKARSQGFGDLVIDPERTNRCVLIDEADKIIFDTVDARNNSAQVNQSIQEMHWIYEPLVKFFKDPKNRALFRGPDSDADECNRQFKAFVTSNLTSEKDRQQLEKISRNQLESWQASAIAALDLEYGIDFTLKANVPIFTKKGPGIVSQAYFISGGAAAENAKFSFGTHQCLHARLNLEKAHVLAHGASQGNLLHQELLQKKYDDRRFPTDPESQIIYSSTDKALIDDYDIVLGVTGTPGAWIERAEKANVAFIDIPRHRGLHRIDRPYKFGRDQQTQFQHIGTEIRNCLNNNQPILLICKDDSESKHLYDYLDKNLTEAEKRGLYRVSADTSIAKEADHVENNAGICGAITVTTARLGRGTDIKLHGRAKTHGIHVMGTYLPKKRDYLQIVGRAGRFGAPGSSRLILNEESLRHHFKNAEKTVQFYTATESYLEHLQTSLDRQTQKRRIIKQAVDTFRVNLTTVFFEQFFKPLTSREGVDQQLVLNNWGKFFDASDKMWQQIWPRISDALANENMEQVELLLQDYHAEVQGYWKGMIEVLKMDFAQSKEVDVSILPSDVGAIKLNQRGIELLKYVETAPVFRTTVVASYDEAYEGRAVIYKGFWQNLWNNVLPSLFSRKDTLYTQARKNGNMSWSQFWLGGNLGTPVEQIIQVFTSSLDDEQSMEEVDIGIKGSSTAKIFSLGITAKRPDTPSFSTETEKNQANHLSKSGRGRIPIPDVTPGPNPYLI